jgi:hypothetical protein
LRKKAELAFYHGQHFPQFLTTLDEKSCLWGIKGKATMARKAKCRCHRTPPREPAPVILI